MVVINFYREPNIYIYVLISNTYRVKKFHLKCLETVHLILKRYSVFQIFRLSLEMYLHSFLSTYIIFILPDLIACIYDFLGNRISHFLIKNM